VVAVVAYKAQTKPKALAVLGAEALAQEPLLRNLL